MSLTRLDVSLEQFEIGISGAVPERKLWSEPAMDRAVLEFVSLISGLVFKYGGRIVHGAHPALTPVILRQARLQSGSRLRRPVTLVMSDLWARDLPEEAFDSMTDIAELVITRAVGAGGPENPETRNRSLTAMRRVLIDAQNLMILVGGKMHEGDGMVPGLGEEMALAAEKRIPRFLVAGLGGFAKELARDLIPASLHNQLSDEENVTLFCTQDVVACVNILFQQMATNAELAKAVPQPIKWNPALKAIVDHRDGTFMREVSENILRAVV